MATLAALLEVSEARVRSTVKPLVEMGFLEEAGDSYKIPPLYREGLQITQGKAFGGATAIDVAEIDEN